jgi:hypothetical protein
MAGVLDFKTDRVFLKGMAGKPVAGSRFDGMKDKQTAGH